MSHCQLLQHSGLKHMRHAGHPCQVSPAHTVSLSAPSCPGAGILSAQHRDQDANSSETFIIVRRVHVYRISISSNEDTGASQQNSRLYGTIMRQITREPALLSRSPKAAAEHRPCSCTIAISVLRIEYNDKNLQWQAPKFFWFLRAADSL